MLRFTIFIFQKFTLDFIENISPWFSQLELVGVKCRKTFLLLASHSSHPLLVH
jgi:hypothetical protein